MIVRALLLASAPLPLIVLMIWADEADIVRFADPFASLALVAIYLIGATGILTLPTRRKTKCVLGAFYTVAIVPLMMFAGLLTSCAMGDCI